MASPVKDVKNLYRAAQIYNKTEIDYFGKKLTKDEREKSRSNEDFKRVVKANLEKEGLGHYHGM